MRSIFGMNHARRMVAGARDKIRKIRGLERDRQNQDELLKLAKRGEELEQMKSTNGWALVAEYIAARKEVIFKSLMSSESDSLTEFKAAVGELEALTKWMDCEIDAGQDAGERLEMQSLRNTGGTHE